MWPQTFKASSKHGCWLLLLLLLHAAARRSTNIHYLLQNLGVKQLILVGCVTDQCVAHAVKDACDLGYLVTLLTGGHGGEGPCGS